MGKISSNGGKIMKRTIGLMLAIVFAMAVWMPTNSSAQITIRTYRTYHSHEQRERQRERERRWRSRMYRSNYGYRNYDRYRGNEYDRYGRNEARYRPFRMQRQTYYINGRRYTRMVRVYY